MRYVLLFWVRLRASLQMALQYRVEFFVGSIMAVFWMFWNLMPMVIVWGQRPSIAGWSFGEALLVTAWFSFLRSLLEGAVQPSLIAVVEHIRTGTLDFVLLKPADAQFLASTAKFEVLNFVDAFGAVGLAVFALARLHHVPSLTQLLAALLLTVTAAALLYALAILVISAAFYVVRLDNLIYLFNSIFDAGRWPASVFRGVWRIVFTFVIPLALMTTYPALALLGRLDLSTVARALAGTTLFVLLARVTFSSSIRHYRSASS